MSANERRKRNLKRRLFARDGWQGQDENWYVQCAFGCGDILDWATATIDRYPIKGEHGGKYEYDNTRLACRDCNSACRNKNDPNYKTRRQVKRERLVTKSERKALRRSLRQIELNRQMRLSQTAEGPSRNGEIRMDF